VFESFISTMDDYNLFVYIVGLDNTPFTVRIPRSKTVGDLKKAILNENPNVLKDWDAAQLTLYKVSLLDDDSLKKNAEKAIKSETSLRPTWELSDYWQKSPKSKTVHVLVEVGGVDRHIVINTTGASIRLRTKRLHGKCYTGGPISSNYCNRRSNWNS
jgi:hypothetical protein